MAECAVSAQSSIQKYFLMLECVHIHKPVSQKQTISNGLKRKVMEKEVYGMNNEFW